MQNQFLIQLTQEAKQLIGTNDELARVHMDLLCKHLQTMSNGEQTLNPRIKITKLESPEGLDLSSFEEIVVDPKKIPPPLPKAKRFDYVRLNKRYLNDDLVIEIPDKEDPDLGAIAHHHWLALNENLGWIRKIDDGFRRAVGYRYARSVERQLGMDPIRDHNKKTYIPRSHAMLWQKALLKTYLAAPSGRMELHPIFFEKKEL